MPFVNKNEKDRKQVFPSKEHYDENNGDGMKQ